MIDLENINIDKIEINYILSKNRSGSTLLSYILNKNPFVISLSEENIYWLLKRDYSHYSNYSDDVILKYLNDLFFLTQNSNKFSAFSFCKTEQIFQSIKKYKGHLNYDIISKIACSHAYFGLKDVSETKQIINKELQFNPLIDELYNENKKTKFIILTRDPRAIVYSSIKNNMGRSNYIYQAEKWYIEMKPLALCNIPETNLLHIKYEDLISDPSSTINKICNFLNIEYSPSMLNNDNSFENIISKLNKTSQVSKEVLNLLNSRHTNTFSNIDKSKINEWETDKAFNKQQKIKIDFICKEVAEKFGYNCSSEEITLNLFDKIQQWLSRFDHFIAINYLLLPVKYKRALRTLNIFKFYR